METKTEIDALDLKRRIKIFKKLKPIPEEIEMETIKK